MNVAVGAQSVGRVELAILGAIESVGFLTVVEADHVSAAQIGSGASFDPAFRIRLALGGVGGFTPVYSRCRELPLDVIAGIPDLPENGRAQFHARRRRGSDRAWDSHP